MVSYSHLLKYFPQFVVIHTVKGFDLVNKAEIDVFFLPLAQNLAHMSVTLVNYQMVVEGDAQNSGKCFTTITILFFGCVMWDLSSLARE